MRCAGRLAAAGARTQRPRWASTGVEDPNLPDTTYVRGLVIAGTVNTMPGSTPAAFADHGTLPAHAPAVADFTAARDHFAALERVGVDFTDVTDALEHEGLRKFEDNRSELGESVARAMHAQPGAADAGSGDGGLLAIYLGDHCAAAAGGLELFRRAADAREDERDGHTLAELAEQVEEDRTALARLMTDLGVSTSPSETAAGRPAETAGRLKTNGHLFSRSPLSDVLEAEAMLTGVQGAQPAGAPCAPTTSTCCWNAPSGRARRWRRCAPSRRPGPRGPGRGPRGDSAEDSGGCRTARPRWRIHGRAVRRATRTLDEGTAW
ncbi:transaldolase family protein [Streptomyces sp. NPDC048507]|uniref:transaldolase family protein n=1 Tax=Streptomyces sp. NPDC048507 TaxID=3365560 RepID=UPI003716D0FA